MTIEEMYPDRVTEKFIGKNIFVTGGTGFIGKVLIEKILRVCPDVGCIYLLIRPKKGKDPQTRIKELLANPLFEKLRSLQSLEHLMKKCRVIEGDISEVNLGIKDEDRKLLKEKIDYIYHIAATVRFDEPLKNALLMNTRGTKFMLELAKECKNLQIFCHVSTAYVNPNVKILEEKAYPAPADPHAIIETIEKLPADVVDSLTPKYLMGLPNTYTLTKFLSETLVVEQMESLPIIIVRPSVVIPVWKEPIPGWGDNINGPMGLMIAAGKGIVRSMHGNGDYYADFLTVDVAVNALCTCTWDYLTNKESRIYNLTTSDEVQFTWRDIIDTGKKIVQTRTPFNNAVWYPGGGLTDSRVLHFLIVFFCQIIPAIILDSIIFCSGNKPVLIRVQKRIWKGSELLVFYTSNQWNFDKTNVSNMRDLLNPLELKTYNITGENFNFEEYINNTILGARRYILKEPDSTLPAARRHMKIMWWVDKIFKTIFILGIIYYMYNKILS